MSKGPVQKAQKAMSSLDVSDLADRAQSLAKSVNVPGRSQGPNWGKIGMIGAGVAAGAAGAAGAARFGGRVVERLREPAEQIKKVVDQASEGADKAQEISEAVSEKSNPVSKAGAALRAASDGDGGRDNLTKLRLIIKESVDVAVPRHTAYNQWTQFEDLPSILKGVDSVDQDEEDDVVQWTAKVGPSRRRWTAEIDEQIPDERIVWHSTDGAEHRGAVTFHKLDSNLTRVQVEMEYYPQGFVEKVGNIFLSARRRVRKDLRLFKHYMELANEETGSWRGEISKEEDGPGVVPPEEGEQAKGQSSQAGEGSERSQGSQKRQKQGQGQGKSQGQEQGNGQQPQKEKAGSGS